MRFKKFKLFYNPLIKEVLHYDRKLSIIVIFVLLIALGNIILGFLYLNIINKAFELNYDTLINYALIWIFIVFVIYNLDAIVSKKRHYIFVKSKNKILKKIVLNFMKNNLETIDKINLNEFVDKIQKGVNSFLNVLDLIFSESISAIFIIFILALVFFGNGFILGLGVFVIIILLIIVLVFLGKQVFYYGKKGTQFNNDINNNINELILNVKSVKLFDKNNYFYDKLKKSIKNNERYEVKIFKLWHVSNIIKQILVNSGRMFILIYVILGIQNSTLNYGHIVMLFYFYELIIRELFSLTEVAYRLNQSVSSLNELVKLYNKTEENIEVNEGIELRSINKIEFRNVSFKYAIKDNFAIKKINFIINKGEKVALVGMSGSGKTTIIKLMLGFYKDYLGQILINDIELKKYNINSVRKCISVSFQNVEMFNDSILNNISLNDNNCKNGIDKIKYCTLLEDFFKNDNSANIEFNANNISGGQKQRISIARAIYKEHNLLVLDEATSNLDFETEYKLYKRLFKYESDKMVLIVVHRLQVTKWCDKIFVLSKGKIEEKGDYKKLVKLKGKFNSLLNYSKYDKLN